jgi:hypothetical protein
MKLGVIQAAEVAIAARGHLVEREHGHGAQLVGALGHQLHIGARGAVPARPGAAAGAHQVLVIDVGAELLALHRRHVHRAQAKQQALAAAQGLGQHAGALGQRRLLDLHMAVAAGGSAPTAAARAARRGVAAATTTTAATGGQGEEGDGDQAQRLAERRDFIDIPQVY